MTVNELKKFATDVRIETVKCLEARTFGHIGGCLSIADVLTVLYNGELKNIDPKNPKKPDRDMLVVSKGHAGPAVFATLALKGYFPLDWLPTLCEGGTRLPSHCDRIRTPGIDASTGSLGQGLSLANGFAHAAKIKDKKNRIYCLMGDGDNTKAALITRGIAEIARLGTKMGARVETFGGLSGIGDLIVTCASVHSRNRKAGYLIGKGYTMQQAMDEVQMVVEGVYSAKAAKSLAEKYEVEMPIIMEVNKVLFEDKPAADAVRDLMLRDKKVETPMLPW